MLSELVKSQIALNEQQLAIFRCVSDLDSNPDDISRLEQLIADTPGQDLDCYQISDCGYTKHLLSLVLDKEQHSPHKLRSTLRALIVKIIEKIPSLHLSDKYYRDLFYQNTKTEYHPTSAPHPLHYYHYNGADRDLCLGILDKTKSQDALNYMLVSKCYAETALTRDIIPKISDYSRIVDADGFVEDEPSGSGIPILTRLFDEELYDVILELSSKGQEFEQFADERQRIPMIWSAAIDKQWQVVQSILSERNASSLITIDGFNCPTLYLYSLMHQQYTIAESIRNITQGEQPNPSRQDLIDYSFILALAEDYNLLSSVLPRIAAKTIPEGEYMGINLIGVICASHVTNLEAAKNFISLCLQYGIDIDGYHTRDGKFTGFNNLWLAIEAANYTLAEHLLELGACPRGVNLLDELPQSGLQMAVHCREWDLAKKLVLSGACPNFCIQNHENFILPPIFYAIFHSDYDCVKFLVEHGADINAVIYESDSSTKTTLEYALDWGCHQIIEYLLFKGANLFPTLSEHNTGYSTDLFNRLTSYMPDLTVSALLLHFANHPPQSRDSVAFETKYLQTRYDAVLKIFNELVKLPFFNNNCNNYSFKPQLPYSVKAKIVNKWLFENHQGAIIDFIPKTKDLSSTIAKLLEILDDSVYAKLIAIAQRMEYQVVFASLVRSLRTNVGLVYRDDAMDMQQHKDWWNRILYLHFCDTVMQYASSNDDLSSNARQIISRRAADYTPAKAARIGYNSDFTWFFKYCMYGVNPRSTQSLIDEQRVAESYDKQHKSALKFSHN